MEKNLQILYIIVLTMLFVGIIFWVDPTFSLAESSDRLSLVISVNQARPGQEVIVSYTASPDWGSDAWIGLIPSDIPLGDQKIADENDIDYQYLNNSVVGEKNFMMPAIPGVYEFRLYPSDDDSYPEVAVSQSIRVGIPPTGTNPSLPEFPLDTLPSFPDDQPAGTPSPTSFPGMNQIVSSLSFPNSTPIPNLSDISTFPFSSPSIDQLPALTPSVSPASLPPTDTEPPRVVMTDPNSGAIEIATNTQIHIQFDDLVQPGEAFHSIEMIDQNQKNIAIEKETLDDVLLIKPQSDLDSKTTYQVVLPYRSVTDKAGNPLPDTFLFSFTTIVPPPVSMLSLPFVGGKSEEILDIPLHYNGYRNTAQIEMELTFHPDLLEFLGVVAGEINPEWLARVQFLEAGRVGVTLTQANNFNLIGENGIIAVLKFRVLKASKTVTQSQLILEKLRLFDQKHAQLPGTVMNGMFHLMGSGTPTPTTTPFVIDQADMTVEPSSLLNGKIGEKYPFKAILENVPLAVKAIKYQWNFGDGSKVAESADGEMTHIYSQSGQFELTVKAFDRGSGKMITMKKMKVGILESPHVSPETDSNGNQPQQHTYREKHLNGKLKIQYTYVVRPDGTQVKNGLETSWYENGKKKSEGEYQNGKKEGIWISWYENGVIGQKGSYQNDQRERIWIKHYRNGNKESEGSYINNRREGQWRKWYENGQLWAEFECRNDQILPGSYKEYRQQ